ncbi:MAG: YdeI/OmpD-associated family protein [Bacteroidota bacterium]
MTTFQSTQAIRQLEKRKGGYYYIKIDASTVDRFSRKRATRLICEIDDKVSYRCGLNHFGDGNFFLIIATKHLKTLQKELGDEISFTISEDPNPLGVDVPEVLEALLAQDEDAKHIYDSLTDGKKRGLIHTINRIKNIDKQVDAALRFLEEEQLKKEEKERKKRR